MEMFDKYMYEDGLDGFDQFEMMKEYMAETIGANNDTIARSNGSKSLRDALSARHALKYSFSMEAVSKEQWLSHLDDNFNVIKSFVTSENFDIWEKHDRGDSYLHTACFHSSCEIPGSFDIIKLLVENGIDINMANDRGNTPVMLIAKIDNIEILQYLIDNGAKLDDLDEYGKNLLHLQCESLKPNLEIVKLLLSLGIDKNHQDNKGITPLMLSFRGKDYSTYLVKHNEITFHIIDSGCDLNLSENNGYTILHLVVRKGNKELLEKLLTTNIDKSIADNHGRTFDFYLSDKKRKKLGYPKN